MYENLHIIYSCIICFVDWFCHCKITWNRSARHFTGLEMAGNRLEMGAAGSWTTDDYTMAQGCPALSAALQVAHRVLPLWWRWTSLNFIDVVRSNLKEKTWKVLQSVVFMTWMTHINTRCLFMSGPHRSTIFHLMDLRIDPVDVELVPWQMERNPHGVWRYLRLVVEQGILVLSLKP